MLSACSVCEQSVNHDLCLALLFQDATPNAKFNGLLEKKWTSVVRLQKKVCLPRFECVWGEGMDLATFIASR